MASTTELKALEDINCTLLTTGRWSDVTLVVGEKTAAAHKLILALRSPVFAALFAELSNVENRVEIDVQADVLDHFIAFIYTGKVPALEPKMAQGLLAASEKYQLEQLKSITEDYLCSQLCPESVASLHSLAEAVNASKLKDKCLKLLSSPLPPVARLKDPCLVALFRQLPPADQITARTVCHRWADLVPYAARSTRSLAILINQDQFAAEDQMNHFSHGPDWELLELLKKEDGTPLLQMHTLSQWNLLHLAELDQEAVTAITATFPVLKELQLFGKFYNEDEDIEDTDCSTATPHPLFFDHLVRLLEHWRPQLTTLKLDIRSFFEDASSCSRLDAAISSLPALKHLAFNLYWNRQLHCPPLTNLPQLTHINANSTQFADILQQQQYDPQNLALVQISYDLGDWRFDYGEDEYDEDEVNNAIIHKLASLNQDLRHRFVRIGFPVHFQPTIRHLFPSLTSVYVMLSDVTFGDFLSYTAQLTQLVHLQLDIDFATIRPEPQRHLPQLKSVKLLHLEIRQQQSHDDLKSLNLPWTMVNVQVVKIDFVINPLQCTTCGIINTRPTYRDDTKKCLRQLLRPLKRDCAQLHTIQYGYDLVEELGITANELLAEPATGTSLAVN